MLKSNYKIYDLTHTLNSSIPTWEGSCDFTLKITKNYEQGYCQQAADIRKLGVGTHIDAPSHFCKNGLSVDKIALEDLITSAHVIKLSDRAHADYEASVQDIIEYEKKHGDIQKNSLVIFYMGWDKHWPSPINYRNAGSDHNMRFPTLSLAAANYLLTKNISGIGIDTLSPEIGKLGFPIHQLLLGKGIYILENLNNCGLLPAVGAQVFALPPKIADAGEAPIRVIALTTK